MMKIFRKMMLGMTGVMLLPIWVKDMKRCYQLMIRLKEEGFIQ